MKHTVEPLLPTTCSQRHVFFSLKHLYSGRLSILQQLVVFWGDKCDCIYKEAIEVNLNHIFLRGVSFSLRCNCYKVKPMSSRNIPGVSVDWLARYHISLLGATPVQ